MGEKSGDVSCRSGGRQLLGIQRSLCSQGAQQCTAAILDTVLMDSGADGQRWLLTSKNGEVTKKAHGAPTRRRCKSVSLGSPAHSMI